MHVLHLCTAELGIRSPLQAGSHVIDASSTGDPLAVPARHVEYTAACLRILGAPDGVCDGGIGTRQVRLLRCHSNGWPSVWVVPRAAGKARRESQLRRKKASATHHHSLSSFWVFSPTPSLSWSGGEPEKERRLEYQKAAAGSGAPSFPGADSVSTLRPGVPSSSAAGKAPCWPPRDAGIRLPEQVWGFSELWNPSSCDRQVWEWPGRRRWEPNRDRLQPLGCQRRL
jgi:hypothetical protein